MQPSIEKLVIFDYSGTLSIEAPSFGKPDNLVRALAASGLAACGVADPATFWEKIVFPTWDEAGRTPKGYARAIAERIVSPKLPGKTANGEDHASLRSLQLADAAANRFVFLYLDHSRPDDRWRPLLEKLDAAPRIAVAIATDHYAEATGAIIRYLKKWEIEAVSLADLTLPLPAQLPFIVANSADLGFWKADRRFWDILRHRLAVNLQSIVVVDDFGANEADANGYGKPDVVYERREKTEKVIEEAFQTSVISIPFVMDRNEQEGYLTESAKIREVTGLIETATGPG